MANEYDENRAKTTHTPLFFIKMMDIKSDSGAENS